MEGHNKRSIMFLSVAQIVMSAILFTLGMVDGFKIRYGYVSLLYTPCWLAALALPIGVMGLVLACSRRPSPCPDLISAIWSVSVACILYSALTVYMYHRWGMEMLLFYKHLQAGSFSRSFSGSRTYFVKKDTLLEYTEDEKHALAVFVITIVSSIVEIILAAAIAKISGASDQRTPCPPMYCMYQPGHDNPQLGHTNAGTFGNQPC